MTEENALDNKDTSIVVLVRALRAEFGTSVQIVDHWDADLFAIGITAISTTERLLYVSTYGGNLSYQLELQAGTLPDTADLQAQTCTLSGLVAAIQSLLK